MKKKDNVTVVLSNGYKNMSKEEQKAMVQEFDSIEEIDDTHIVLNRIQNFLEKESKLHRPSTELKHRLRNRFTDRYEGNQDDKRQKSALIIPLVALFTMQGAAMKVAAACVLILTTFWMDTNSSDVNNYIAADSLRIDQAEIESQMDTLGILDLTDNG